MLQKKKKKSKAVTNYNSNSWTFSRLYKSDLELGFYENNNTFTDDRILKVTYIEKKQRKFRSQKNQVH